MTLPDDQKRDAAKRATARTNGQRLTRRRIPLSCVSCRVRKLKCNREKPCQNCVVRGESNAASCTYAEKVDKRGSTHLNPRSDAEDMRKRLNRLENSILSMIDTNGNRSDTPTSSVSHVTSVNPPGEGSDQAGGQKISADTRSTHWDAILNELGAMKDAWSEENDKIEYSSGPVPVERPYRPTLLSGLSQPPDRATILESLPSREAADRLVARFFDSYNPAIPAAYLLHQSTFLKQYRRHWENPTDTKIIWIGLLFGVICIAMQSYARNRDVPPQYSSALPALIDLYRIRTTQCLTIADLTKPVDLMLETLMFYAMIEYSESKDGDIGTFFLSGISMRLALQQGYHRDPSQHPNITPFQGEMRRRQWTCISQHELLFSVLVGLPKAVKFAECDTEPPRNLHEEELYEEMKELPPSRPLTEPTRVCYQVVKTEVMRAYGAVVEFLHLLQPQPFAEVMRLDLNIMQAREMIPDHLKLTTLQEMKNDPPYAIMERYILELFSHKAVVLLHRKFWDSGPEGTPPGKFYYSRKTCVSSAVALLDHQALMHAGTYPGGPLVHMKWYHFAITNHDFLLAAMVICLDVMNLRRHFAGADFPECVVTESQKLNAIQKSRNIWAEIVDDCRDAKRAVNILDAVLSKLAVKTEREKKTDIEFISPKVPLSSSATNPTADSLRFNPYFTDQFGLGMPLPGNPTGQDIVMQDTFPSILSCDLTVPNDFNWDAWDQFMQAQHQPLPQDVSYEFPMQGIPM